MTTTPAPDAPAVPDGVNLDVVTHHIMTAGRKLDDAATALDQARASLHAAAAQHKRNARRVETAEARSACLDAAARAERRAAICHEAYGIAMAALRT